MHIYKVIIPRAKLFPLSYQSVEPMIIGEIVLVPFRNMQSIGIVIAEDKYDAKINYKQIIHKYSYQAIKKEIVDFYLKMASYYVESEGGIAKLALPVDLNTKREIKEFMQAIPDSFALKDLSAEQVVTLNNIASKGTTVLQGVTGSGKTEIYFHLAANILAAGKQVLIMLPEIALTQQIISRFEQSFGFQPVIWNSAISLAEKKKILHAILQGNVKLVIGALSALFFPYAVLGAFVVDEEHDSSYKQDNAPCYNARDMAVLRGHVEQFPVLLCSATPSIETIFNIHNQKYHHILLQNRFGGAGLPHIQLLDMQQQNLQKDRWLASDLITAMQNSLAKKEQVLLFLNRRGYAPLIL